MRQIDFTKLIWPKLMNLDHLAKIIPEESLRKFIVSYARLDRKKRRIILPSLSCLRKIICHHLWSQVESGEKSWEQIKSDLIEEFTTLESIDLKKTNVKRFFDSREKEIMKERNL